VQGLFLLLLWGGWLLAQGKNEECLLVKLRRAPNLTADNALHLSWEEKRLKLSLPDSWEDTFAQADDDEEKEDPAISQCFIPQIKLITLRYTFVVSLACGNFITYQNKAPFAPSDTRVQNPFSFSEDFRYFLEKVIEKHLKITPRRLYAEYALSYVPPPPNISYEELDFLIGQSQIVLDTEDEEEDDDTPPPTENPSDWMGDDDDEKEED